MAFRIGFGQVEPNHLSAQHTAQIYAQLPADGFELLENGMFVKYDYAKNECNLTGEGEWMLVYNEEKLYDTASAWRGEQRKDWAMIKSNYTPDHYITKGEDEDGEDEDVINYVMHERYVDGNRLKGQMVPRVFKTNVGDIFTTNCFTKANTDGSKKLEMGLTNVKQGDKFKVDPDSGYLVPLASGDAEMIWQVARVYTMPDGQFGLKLQRIK